MKSVVIICLILTSVMTMLGQEKTSTQRLVEPEIFAPGVISGASHDTAPAFTPNGETVYFSRSNTKLSVILESHLANGQWSTPMIAPFSGKWNDMEPSMSPDGKFLIFVSSRPLTSSDKPLDGHFNKSTQPGQGGNMWRVERTGSGWSEPKHLPETVNRSSSIFAPSVVADGSLYFMDSDPATGRFQIFRSQWSADEYRSARPAGFSDGSASDVDPAVAPDESYAVFASGRAPALGMDLFIVFQRNGTWGKPIHLGNKVNSPGSDAEARLSPDGKTLYFSSERIISFQQPLESAQAQQALKSMEWNNGLYNIWRVSLAPWLDSSEKN